MIFRKHLTLALSALLAVGACAPCAEAQSGRRPSATPRGRGLSARMFARVGAVEAAGAAAGVSQAAGARGVGFDPRGLNRGRPGAVVYAEHGGEHSNRANKIVGFALLGYFIFVTYVLAKSDGYAPPGRATGGPLLRR